MKKITNYTLTIIVLSILILGMLFLFNSSYWLKKVNPIDYQIVSVKTEISKNTLELDFGIILNKDYFIDYVLDSIQYKVKMDCIKFSEGKKIFSNSYSFEDNDTVFIPLTINMKIIQNIIKTTKSDSLTLEIDFNNFIKLPITGQASFPIYIKKKIATPNPPKVKVLGVEKKILKLHEAIYEIHFEITNPNNYEINIQQINASLTYPELFIGKVNHNEAIIVSPKSSVQTKSEINIGNLNLIKDGFKILMARNKKWAYTLEADLLILKEDSTLMPVQIYNSGKMPFRKKDK